MVDLTERLSVLLKQEKSFYKTHDYLSPAFQEKLQSTGWGDVPKLTISSASTVSSTSSSGINELWREKICEWSYQVVDHFDFSREVVSISMSFLDRYLCTRPVDKKLFQLAAMTTLYLAIKLNEPGTLSMQSMIELSRGYFKVEQMAVMEMVILQ
jgi:lipoyl(octanoyl) transferase